MWLPPQKYLPTTTLLPLPMVISPSRCVWRIAMMNLFTSRSSVMTSSWQGASPCAMTSFAIGCVSEYASLRVRSVAFA